MRVLAGSAAAAGCFYLYTASVLGWRTLSPAPGHGPRLGQGWFARTEAELGGLGVRTPTVLGMSAVAAGVGAALTWALLGGVLPSALGALAAGSAPHAHLRSRRRAQVARAQDAWPQLLEELRLQTGSLGRSIPRATFEVGRSAPPEMQAAFAAARREWAVSTDFERAMTVLKRGLADPAADAICETLLVAHELGGADLDARLQALVDDRIQDVHARKDAQARQAGARFSRRFVIFAPIGMAMAGMSVGNGRSAFATPTGQLLSTTALVLVAVCWWWSGRILRLPPPRRVFGP